MNTDTKFRHTGAEWLAIDRWVKAEQEEKGVRGPKTVAAEAEARAVYNAAREAEKNPVKPVLVEPVPVEPVPVEPKTPVKRKTLVAPPPIDVVVTRRQVCDSEARLATLGAVAGLKANKNTWLNTRRAEILAKMAPRNKKPDLSGLDDWVDPNDPYNVCDYESS
jgi:hypothetical protein